MCGIAGLVDKRLAPEELRSGVREMCDRLVHRGPDDAGYHVEAECAIGMRRLSIIDLAGGHQPIFNEDRSLAVVFNGEIYNYKDLRQELQAKGHVFRTESDTESIVHLYEEEGVEGFRRLRGQFAIAVLHVHSGEVVVARDHLGLKPLFYAQSGPRFAFASELKALRAVGFGHGLNPRAVEQFLVLRYVMAPESIHSDVQKLRAGHYLRYRDGKVTEHPFWTLTFAEDSLDLSEDEYQERTKELLDEAIALRMQADVPFGAFLSGGIDSSVIVALMAERTKRVNTFSVGFSRKKYREYAFSRLVSKTFRTDHVEHTVGTEEFEQAFHNVQSACDEPIGDPAFIPLFCLAAKAAEKVKVVLSGEGADEIFGGYHRYVNILEAHEAPSPDAFRSYLAHCAYLVDDVPLSPEFAKAAAEKGGATEDRLRQIFDQPSPHGLLNKMLHLDLLSWIADNLLVKADRMGMAHSLEVRVPFLDVPLVEHMSAVPERLKIHRGTRKGRWGKTEPHQEVKYLLKRIATGLLPDKIVWREKVGFPVPIRHLLKNELRPFAERVLSTTRLEEEGIFDVVKVRESVRRFLEDGKSSWPVWTLLCFEVWRSTLRDEPPVSR